MDNTPISASALREIILSSTADLPREKVDCRPHWQCDVWVRTLPVGERDDFEDAMLLRKGKSSKREVSLVNLRSRLVAATACDEAGNLLFAPDDVAALSKRGSVPMDKIFAVAQRLSGMSDTDIEELVKN